MRSRTVLVIATVISTSFALGCGAPTAVGEKAATKPSLCNVRESAREIYLGVYVRGFPPSTAPIAQFANAVGVQPDLVTYYPRFGLPFDTSSACAVVRQGAMPVLQIDPRNVSLARIAAGKYDRYLRSFAAAVRTFGDRVVLSFGHEMNGNWYSWGYQHTPAAVFVAAWRHIVDVFRAVGANNVIWMWTVNVINESRAGNIPSPGPWWPGSTYVNWVGIDGYYYKPSWVFVSLFGPTIAAIRAFTPDPILIAETGAFPAAIQPSKIADLFNNVRAYGLLGFIWFDAIGTRNWQITSTAAIEAFRKGANAYLKPSS
jgi:mannan endo-1,4-beta-mannosidase